MVQAISQKWIVFLLIISWGEGSYLRENSKFISSHKNDRQYMYEDNLKSATLNTNQVPQCICDKQYRRRTIEVADKTHEILQEAEEEISQATGQTEVFLREHTNFKDMNWSLWLNIIGCLVCIFCVAIISGLFLGLLTLDPLDLRILLKVSISDEEKSHAKTLLPIVEQHHLVLVTLLLMNGIAYETLPIFMDHLVPSWAAILLSVSVVLFFGEILPSAYFTGPDQLELATRLAPLMRVSLIFFYPFAYPLSKVLDHIVHGGETSAPIEARYNRDELTALIRIQYEERMKTIKSRHSRYDTQKRRQNPEELILENAAPDSSWRSLKREIMEAVDARALEMEDDEDSEHIPDAMEQLNPPMIQEEVNMVEGALQLGTKVAFDVYTPLRKVYALPTKAILDKKTVISIYANGYSRIPVYEERPNRYGDVPDRTGIVGIFMTRSLIVIDWDHERDIGSLELMKIPCVSPRMDLVSLTNLFQTGGSHMALVCAQPTLGNIAFDNDRPLPVEAGFMGIVTLEDVIEELLQDSVHDEIDVRERDRAATTLTNWASKRLKKKRLMKIKNQTKISPAKSLTKPLSPGNTNGFTTEKTPLLTK